MSETEFARVIADRFARWGPDCLRSRAIPIILLGSTSQPSPGIVVFGCEEAACDQTIDLLIAALNPTKGGCKT